MNTPNLNEKEMQDLKAKPTIQRKPNSLFRKLFKYLFVGCFTFYAIVFIALLFEFIFLKNMDLNQMGADFDGGTAKSITELPIVGHDLGKLKTEGQVHYITRVGYHRYALDYLIAGKTTVEGIDEFRKENLILNYRKCRKTELNSLEYIINLMMADNLRLSAVFSEDDYSGEIGRHDLSLKSRTSTIYSLRFWFRPEDGQFFMMAELELTKGRLQSAIRNPQNQQQKE